MPVQGSLELRSLDLLEVGNFTRDMTMDQSEAWPSIFFLLICFAEGP